MGRIEISVKNENESKKTIIAWYVTLTYLASLKIFQFNSEYKNRIRTSDIVNIFKKTFILEKRSLF